MRRIVVFILPLFLACSQMRESAPVPVEFIAEETKAFTETTTSNLDGFYVTAKNSSGRVLWENIHFVKDEGGSRFTGGMYWPLTGTLSFYAISHTYTQTIDGEHVTVQPSPADGDVVSAVKLNAANGSAPSLSFQHIFAALDAIVFTPENGCTINVTSISCSFSTVGTYDITSCSWVDTEAPGTTVPVASPSLENRGLGMLCVPGECTITATYDCSFYGHTESYTTSATVTLPMGSKTTVSGTLKAASGVLELSVIINPWEDNLPVQYQL